MSAVVAEGETSTDGDRGTDFAQHTGNRHRFSLWRGAAMKTRTPLTFEMQLRKYQKLPSVADFILC